MGDFRILARPAGLASAAALLTGLLALAGCGATARPAAGGGQHLKVFRYSMNTGPTNLDPVKVSNNYANAILVNVYDTLFSFAYLARPYRLKPNLADGWPEISSDSLTYTIHIKKGVHFIDDPCFSGGTGRELVAADFVYSIEREFDPANLPVGAYLWQGRIVGLDAWKAAGSHYDQPVAGLRALDRYTLQIRLTRPFPQLLDTFTLSASAVVPHEAVEYYGAQFGIHPVGSGPFRLVSFDTARVVLERNPKFRQEPVDLAAEGYDPKTQSQYGLERIAGRSPPFVDRLEIYFINEPSARWASFTKGDEIQNTTVPAEQLDRVLASRQPIRLRPGYAAKYYMNAVLESGFVYDEFNMAKPAFGYNPDPVRARRNKALRCAILKAIDWKARDDSFYGGIGRIFPGIIPPVVPEFDPQLSMASVTRDVPGAIKLLKDNGWNAGNLPLLTYGTLAGVYSRLFFEQFRAQLKAVGYPTDKVVLKQYATFGDLDKAYTSSELPWISAGWGLDYPDAQDTLQLFYGPNGTPGANSANYHNPEYDRLYEQASVMLPSPARTELYRRMNRIVIGDCVTSSGLSRTRIYLWHKDAIAYPDDAGMVFGFAFRFLDVVH